MPAVTLTELWLHDAGDPATYVTLVLDRLQENTRKPGGVRRYANGRIRTVTAAGVDRAYEVGCDLVDRDTYLTIRDWIDAGTLLLFRDPLGRIEWGNVFDLTGQERPGAVYVDVSFDFYVITFSEEV